MEKSMTEQWIEAAIEVIENGKSIAQVIRERWGGDGFAHYEAIREWINRIQQTRSKD